jgi:hypothetical protein
MCCRCSVSQSLHYVPHTCLAGRVGASGVSRPMKHPNVVRVCDQRSAYVFPMRLPDLPPLLVLTASAPACRRLRLPICASLGHLDADCLLIPTRRLSFGLGFNASRLCRRPRVPLTPPLTPPRAIATNWASVRRGRFSTAYNNFAIWKHTCTGTCVYSVHVHGHAGPL